MESAPWTPPPGALLVSFFPNYHSDGKNLVTSALWTPTLLMNPQGLMMSYAVFSAGLCPTTSSTTSAPRPSVASRIVCLKSLSVIKLSGSAPSDLANSRREGTESIANIFFGSNEVAAMRAHNPTGPHPITTTVVSERWLGVS